MYLLTFFFTFKLVGRFKSERIFIVGTLYSPSYRVKKWDIFLLFFQKNIPEFLILLYTFEWLDLSFANKIVLAKSKFCEM